MSKSTNSKAQSALESTGIVFFPICLLKNAHEDISLTCYDILCFAGYDHARNYDKGEDIGKRMFYAGKNRIGFVFQDSERDYYRGEELYSNLEFKFPKVNIEVSKLVSMLGSDNSSFDVACFLAYCALRSIIQTDPYKDISSAFLLSRMLGSATTIKGLVDEQRKINPDKLPERLIFLSKRYWLEKLKRELQYQYGITIFSAKHYHKTFYSFHLNYKDLKKKADIRRKLSKLKFEDMEEIIITKSKSKPAIVPSQENYNKEEPSPAPVLDNSKKNDKLNKDTWVEYTGSLFKIDDKQLSSVADFRLRINEHEDKHNMFDHYEDQNNFISYWAGILTNGEGKYMRKFELEKNWNVHQRITDWLNSDNAIESKNYKSWKKMEMT